MKKNLLLLFSALSISALAQNPVPNPSFENWSSGNPVSWTTNNFPGVFMPITQSGDAHSGTFAARLEVVSGFSIAVPPGMNTANDFTINQDYPSFSFYYKCNISATEHVNVQATVKIGSSTAGGAGAVITSSSNTNVYTYTVVPITYFNQGANKAHLSFAIAGNTMNIGSYAIIDDVVMGSVTPAGIGELASSPNLSLGQAYPNPATGICFIPFSLEKQAQTKIVLYAMDGKIVQEVLNENLNAGRYKAEINAAGLSAGLYICKLSSNGSDCYTKVLVK